jgi:hypothetical protein
MTTSPTCAAALKEWAVAVEALGTGRQVLILRKGGIREENNRFEVLFPEFLLSPSFEHQQYGLLKPEHAEALTGVFGQAADPDALHFRYLAKVHRAFAVSEAEELRALAPFHIWSDAYAETRLRWRPRVPLTAMVLRVFAFPAERQVPVRPEYAGCRSWLPLLDDVSSGLGTPVLDDAAFAETADAIDRAIDAARAAVARP